MERSRLKHNACVNPAPLSEICLRHNIYYVYTYVIKHHIKIQCDISRDFKEKTQKVII